jgi:hypothetical protein
MTSACDHISDFYQSLINSKEYKNIVAQKSYCLFGGGSNLSYMIPTDTGLVK